MTTFQISTFSGRVGNKDNALAIIEVGAAERGGLLGKSVVWTGEKGTTIKGKIARLHGTKALVIRFERGLPGGAVGSTVRLSGGKAAN